jgi:apoptotic chromatin condensation inducer in the nucleus
MVLDEARKLARSPSPPRRKPTNILYITHLVRPFTVQQLKNLLLRTGQIAENGFWIDKIKSKCYVEVIFTSSPNMIVFEEVIVFIRTF